MTNAIAPPVSIIIPCYNAERFVGDTIESALKQSYPNIEVIVVNDGSTDGSLEVVQSFGDRIRVYSGPNRGASAARNCGFEMAQGDWIHYLDADDVIHPDKIAISLQAHTTFPDTSFIWSPLRHVDTEFRLSLRHSKKDNTTALPLCSYVTNALHAAHAPATALFQRTFLGQVGPWDTNLRRWTDLEYHSRIAALRPSYVALPEALYFYRQHSGPRISAANASFTGFEAGCSALERARATLNATWPDKNELARYLAPFYLNLARSAVANGKLSEFKALLSEADRLRCERCFHWKCKLALASASLVGTKMTSMIIERTLKI